MSKFEGKLPASGIRKAFQLLLLFVLFVLVYEDRHYENKHLLDISARTRSIIRDQPAMILKVQPVPAFFRKQAVP